MESDPDFLGPAALAKGMRFVGDPATARRSSGSRTTTREHGIWDCTRCYFCNERCPKGVDPRDAIAKLGAESIKEGIDRDMGAKHAKWFVTLGEDDRLAARDGARAEDAGRRLGDQADEVRAGPRAGAARCRRRSRRTSPRTSTSRGRSTTSSRRRAATARSASSRASTRSARIEFAEEHGTEDVGSRGAAGRGAAARRRMKKVAYYKGCLASLSAKELDIVDAGARAEGRARAASSSSRSRAAAPATSTRPSPTTTST